MHLASLLITLLYYGLLGICLYGFGIASAGLFRRIQPSLEELSPPLLVWLGFAGWLLLLQVLHLVVPVTAVVVIPLLAIGLAMAGLRLAHALQSGRRPRLPLRDRTSAYGALLVLLAVIWIASRSMLHPANYDAGLYYLNSIRWINSYPIVPGLGNLHGRLAFNQSFFTYVAALNLFPFFGHGRSVANSFLLILSLWTVLHMLRPALTRPAELAQLPAGQWIPPLFVLPILVFLGISSKDLASPGPDLAVNLLLIMVFLLFCRLLEDHLRNGRWKLSPSVMVTTLSATAITVKLSIAVPATLFAGLSVAACLWSSSRRWRDAVLLLAPPALILLVWMGRGIITSGAPLYPSTFGHLHTGWSVPREAIIAEAETITGWARKPWVHYSEVPAGWDWLGEWAWRISHYTTEVLHPAGASALLALGAIVLRRTRRCGTGTVPRAWWLPVIPLLGGLVFWFLAAPDPRFAGALFYLLPVAAAIAVGLLLQKKCRARTFLPAVGIVFLAVNFNFLKWAYVHRDRFCVISYEGWHDITRPPLNVRVTSSGLPVLVPATGEQCWDAPLPCTPLFNEQLKLRRESDLSAGFTVE